MSPNLFSPPSILVGMTPAAQAPALRFRLWFRRHRCQPWRAVCTGTYDDCSAEESERILNDGAGDYYVAAVDVDPNCKR